MAKILITGCTGQLGQELTRLLVKDNEIIGSSRSTGIVKINHDKCKNDKCDGWIRYKSDGGFSDFDAPFMYLCKDCNKEGLK